ncbi:MAG: hypothetical protein K9J21_12540 [Bacteroidales bacterium]|nr:hypothetical protein [Bacteroidales bacterium]
MKDFAIPKIQKQLRKVSTVQAALEAETPSLAVINKKFGEDFTQAYIEGWIVHLREFLNIGRKMTDEQTQETAMLILDEYYNISIADINIIFKRAKLGRWGQIYDRLDGQLILSWFDEYFQERCKASQEKSILEADKYKGDPYQRFSTQAKNKEQAAKVGAFIEHFKDKK